MQTFLVHKTAPCSRAAVPRQRRFTTCEPDCSAGMGEGAEPPSKAGEPLPLFLSPTDTIKGEDGSRLLLQSQMEIHVGSGAVRERKALMNLDARTFPSHPNPVPWTPLKHHSSQPEPPIHPIPSKKGITGTLERDELAARAAPWQHCPASTSPRLQEPPAPGEVPAADPSPTHQNSQGHRGFLCF